MTKAYQEGKGFAARIRQDGHDIYVSGYPTKKAALDALHEELVRRRGYGSPQGKGPNATSLAQALQQYGLQQLGFLKGAPQDVRRYNKYLRSAGLRELSIELVSEPQQGGAFHKIALLKWGAEHKIPNGLTTHRRELLSKTADSDKHRACIATMKMAEVRRHHVQGFMNALRKDGMAPATVQLERALLRRLFNFARTKWNWRALTDNPATDLAMPQVDNVRKRVMSDEEQKLLDEAMSESYNQTAPLVMTLLRETGMRATEPLKGVCWRHVDWSAKMLRLNDAKAGPRDVALSPVALDVLRKLGPGEPEELIVQITYEALRASWRRVCKKAGIKDLRIHDLRRTGATRLALKTGNIFLVQAFTGHKTLKMVERYVNVGPQDLLAVLHAPDEFQLTEPAGAGEAIAAPMVPMLSLTAEHMSQLIAQAVAAGVQQGARNVESSRARPKGQQAENVLSWPRAA